MATSIKDDRREAMRTAAAAAAVRRSLPPEFQRLSADEIMFVLRGDGPVDHLLPPKAPRRRSKMKP